MRARARARVCVCVCACACVCVRLFLEGPMLDDDRICVYLLPIRTTSTSLSSSSSTEREMNPKGGGKKLTFVSHSVWPSARGLKTAICGDGSQFVYSWASVLPYSSCRRLDGYLHRKKGRHL